MVTSPVTWVWWLASSLASLWSLLASLRSRQPSLGQLTERDVVHDTLSPLVTLQLNGRHLHQEGVLVTVELEKVVIQLGCDARFVPAIEVPVGGT